jgi:hypothetical protein
MRQIEVINLETIIDVTAETSNVEILVQDYDSELSERFALEAQEAAIDAEQSADIATAQASIATAQATIATTQAGIATTQAGNALTSANNAAASAQEAQDIVDSIITADLTEATSSVLTITGGTDAVLGTGTTIQVKQAGSSQSGFLSSTDWTTFNSKQNTITNPVTGTGASGQVAFWNGTSSQTGDNGLFWDNTNKRLGVGTNAPTQPFHINANAIISSNSLFCFGNVNHYISNISGIFQIFSNSNTIRIRQDSSNPVRVSLSGAGSFFSVSDGSSDDTFIVRKNGNVQIGTTTDAGFRLDVNGTARVQGELTVGNGTDAIIRVNSSVAGNFSRLNLISNTTNFSTMLDIRPNGTNTSLTGFYLRDSSTAASGTNIVFFGRGDATLPSTGVSYLGAIVTAQINANSLHLGFLVSNTSAGRIEAARIWNSGNLYLQKGGTFTDVASAILNVNSTTQGFLPPRMTTTQKNAIASPAEGLVVYDTTLNKLCVRGALTWETITSL